MSIFKIIAIGIISVSIIVLIKESKPELAIMVSVCASIVLLILIINALSDVVIYFTEIVDKTGISYTLFVCILKIIGIGYITEFAANICEDSGNKSIANKIQFGGKVVIMIVSLPIIQGLIDIITGLLA